MADQKNQSVQLALSILESALGSPPEPPKEKKSWFKRYAKIGLVVLVCVVVLVTVILDLIVLRSKTPKFRLTSVTVNDLSVTNSTTSPSFYISLDAVYAVKNPNSAPFHYPDTYITFWYRGKLVGEGRVNGGKAKAVSTKVVGFKVSLSSRALSTKNLGRDIGSGVVGLSVASELRGHVELLKVIKKKKTPEISCAMVVNLVDEVVQDLKCD
ncbi:hypothetical protein Vadar_023378 [Vaccinium darrowii]|uniref:Uncharacterized protein n=1 Tax=Vaccinium darrowii TaxID=229202 RepID=A0ACB7YP22_9ERIC|nr:hypothetical protein Vadar_023378 [Vaccinium darrowii]